MPLQGRPAGRSRAGRSLHDAQYPSVEDPRASIWPLPVLNQRTGVCSPNKRAQLVHHSRKRSSFVRLFVSANASRRPTTASRHTTSCPAARSRVWVLRPDPEVCYLQEAYTLAPETARPRPRSSAGIGNNAGPNSLKLWNKIPN